MKLLRNYKADIPASIVVVFVSLILLFVIALILARGLYRSIQKRDGKAPLGDYED